MKKSLTPLLTTTLGRAVVVLVPLIILFTATSVEAFQSSLDSYQREKLHEATSLIHDGDYEQGIAILQDILRESPGSRDALFLLAVAYEWQGEFEEAEKIYRTIVSVNENDLEAWGNVAKLEAWRGRYNEAIALYGNLIAKFGDEPFLLIGLARALSWNNRLEEALQYYDRVTLQEQDNVEALVGKAQVLRWMGEPREARRVIRRAQFMDPSNPEVKRESAEIDLALGSRFQVSYSESLEKDYLRSENMYYYNLGNKTWRARSRFLLEAIDELSLDLWSARDWEVDKTLDAENFRLSSVGFAAGVNVRLWSGAAAGGSFSVCSYENDGENVIFRLHGEEERDETFELWLLNRYRVWDARASFGTRPFFHRETRETPPLSRVEIGEQKVGQFVLGRNLLGTARASLGYEAGSYSDGNYRNKIYAAIEGSPRSAPWATIGYRIHYQDFEKVSRDYFTPLGELNHGLHIDVARTTATSSLGAGLSLGQSHSENFGDIFSIGSSAQASRSVAERWRIFASGLVSYDDNKYSIGSVALGLEVIL